MLTDTVYIIISVCVCVCCTSGYEEDFEADDEGPMDDGVDKGNETSFNREEENERKTDGNNLKDSIKNRQFVFFTLI